MVGWIEATAIVSTGLAVIGTIIATQRYNESKRSSIYARFDTYKKAITSEMRDDYSRKDMCVLRHEQVAKELREIQAQTQHIPEIITQLKILVNGTKSG